MSEPAPSSPRRSPHPRPPPLQFLDPEQQTPVVSNRATSVSVKELPQTPSLHDSPTQLLPSDTKDQLLGSINTTIPSPPSEDAIQTPKTPTHKEIATTSTGMFGWFSGSKSSSSSNVSSSTPKPSLDSPHETTATTTATQASETYSSSPSPSPVDNQNFPLVSKRNNEIKSFSDDKAEVEVSDPVQESDPADRVEGGPAEDGETNGGDDETKSAREMTPEERQELDDAFAATTSTTSPTNIISQTSLPIAFPHGRLTVTNATTPHAETCLKLLRKFAYQTRPHILKQYGGSQSRSILSYLRSVDVQEASTFGAYQTLMDCIFEENEDRDAAAAASSSHLDETSEHQHHPSDRILVASSTAATADSSTNGSSRVMAAGSTAGITSTDPAVQFRAAAAVAAFVDLFAVWGHASSAFLEKKDKKGQAQFSALQVIILNTASNLTAYGCLDHVQIAIGSDSVGTAATTSTEHHVAAQMLASSVFNSDLSLERVELAAMKFLLGTGCRQNPSLLRGSYLLQSIRTLYHVYLTTESTSNKITARAALQQLVTSIFAKVVQINVEHGSPVAPEQQQDNANHGIFPTENHRDAFLVLRSICKLSMRNLPEDAGMHSHVGLQTSASNDTWDGERLQSASERANLSSFVRDQSERSHQQSLSRSQQQQHTQHAHLIYTGAIHPALESKLLALELILYVLQHVDFAGTGFIQHCGPQFQLAIRNYLCVSLLKNCTSDNTRVVSLSLSIFVPLLRNFRTVLKNEIEAFVTNVFFVILDSKNSPAEHKSIVVNTFNEICSDPNTLAEIFLNYDCDLSAVDLFHRIVNTLSRLSRSGLQESMLRSYSGMSSLMGGPSEAQMEKFRNESRELRLDAMRALRQILASLHSSIVEPLGATAQPEDSVTVEDGETPPPPPQSNRNGSSATPSPPATPTKQSLVEIYGSKKKRRAEEMEAILRFNQKPSAGIAFAAKSKHIDAEDPTDVARYLLKNKDELDKAMIGEYLGREAEYQNGFSLRVLHEYVRLMDFTNLVFDDAIRFFLSGFRLPGEAQKVTTAIQVLVTQVLCNE